MVSSTEEAEDTGLREEEAGEEEDEVTEEGEEEEEEERKDGEWFDILGSGAVLKRTVKEGSGAFPEYKQNVWVKYELRVASTGHLAVIENAPVMVTVGDQTLETVVPGLMLAIKMMRQGEVSLVKINHRFAYAHDGFAPNIGPNEDIEATVEMVRLGPFEKEAVEMTPEELIVAVRRRKERGNFFFKMSQFNKALRCYQEGLKMSESHLPPAQAEDGNEELPPVQDDYNTNPDLLKLRAECAGNLGACFEKQEKWKEAKDACIAVLGLDPVNLKALLRAARVSAEQGEYLEATACIKRAREAHPEDPHVLKEADKLKKRIQRYKEKNKKVYGGFLKPTSPTTSQPIVQPAQEEENVTEETPAPQSVPDAVENPTEKPKSRRGTCNVLIRQLQNILILFAPTIIAGVVFLFLPQATQAHGQVAKPWNNLGDDLAQKELVRIEYESLICEGIHQRASCCVCLNMMEQAQARLERASRVHAGEKYDVGFRVGSNKQSIPFEQSELVLSTLLDNVCNRLPVDIPKSESPERLNRVKAAISRACTKMMDEFYDPMLENLRLDTLPKNKPMPRAICEHVVGVCEPREPWQIALQQLGPAYETFPCALCRQVAQLVAEKQPTLDQLRLPASLCSQLQVSIPKAEQRISLVSRQVGSACIELLYTRRRDIVTVLQDRSPNQCITRMEATLCDAECEQ